MKNNLKLTLIIPAYNPHNGWEKDFIKSLNELQKELYGIEYYITLINDGSTYDIGTFVENHILTVYKNLKYFSYPENMGKGFAIRYGLEHSLSDYYIYTDFDFPFGIHSLKQTYDILAEGRSNLVIGTRNYSYFRTLPFERKVLSMGLMFFNSVLTGFRVKDTQAGLKGLDNKARDIFLTIKTNSFVFEVEFILKCLKANLKHRYLKVVADSDIKFSNFGSRTIRSELKNYFRIIIGRG